MNCLAKPVIISTLRMKDLEEKVMGRLGGVSAHFPLRDLIMFHRREG